MLFTRFKHIASDKIYSGNLRRQELVTDEGNFALNEVKFLAPVQPSQIICVGLNYQGHAEETGNKIPESPALFFKPPSAVIGPNDEIILPSSSRVDYEGEVAVVIKKKCRKVTKLAAEKYIWGYTCLNDVTDRGAQKWEQNWVRAKGFDTSCPLGPVVATPEEIEKPLKLELRLNGEVKQKCDTTQLIFSIPELIEEISSFMTLKRGDVISTGTPAGIGPLSEGDQVEVEIDGVGVLANEVSK